MRVFETVDECVKWFQARPVATGFASPFQAAESRTIRSPWQSAVIRLTRVKLYRRSRSGAASGKRGKYLRNFLPVGITLSEFS
jgi:hypothetical protein